MNIRKIALVSILTALAIAIAIAESFIPSVWIPGIKLGLANIIILITLYEVGVLEAILVDLCRVIVASLVRGTFLGMGFVMSIAGAILSLLVMILFKVLIKKFSIVGVSVIGAIFHVFGQILVAVIYLGTGYIVFYLPVIALSAIATGVFVGIIAKLIINTGVIRMQRERYKF